MRKMHPIFPITLSILIAGLPACAATPKTEFEDCDAVRFHEVTYGVKNNKTIFQVKEKVSVTRGNALVFKLKPKNTRGTPVDFENALVTIVGKSDDPKNSWITEISGKFKDGDELGVCVPNFVDTELEYEYLVHVEGLGTLDPRVIVKL